MFQGIIRHRGRVLKRPPGKLIVAARPALTTRPGSSIAVNGVCLSVVKKNSGWIEFDLGHETLQKTTLGNLRLGSLVNLEPPLRLGDGLDGHIVLGHVDGVGQIAGRRPQGNSVIFTISYPKNLARWITSKGSIALDGVSLTINEVLPKGKKLTVCLIPETLKRTTLISKMPGDLINIEADYLAKIINKRA